MTDPVPSPETFSFLQKNTFQIWNAIAGHIHFLWIAVGKTPCWPTYFCDTKRCSGIRMKKLCLTIKSKTDQGGDWSHATARNRVRDAKEGSREVGSQVNMAGAGCLFIANLFTGFWRFANALKRPLKIFQGQNVPMWAWPGHKLCPTWPYAQQTGPRWTTCQVPEEGRNKYSWSNLVWPFLDEKEK